MGAKHSWLLATANHDLRHPLQSAVLYLSELFEQVEGHAEMHPWVQQTPEYIGIYALEAVSDVWSGFSRIAMDGALAL